MSERAGHWSFERLRDFLTLVSSFADEPSAVRGALEWAVDAVGADVGAVLQAGEVVAAVGFPPGAAPAAALRAVADAGADALDVAGVGPCPAVVAPIHAPARVGTPPPDGARGRVMILARRGGFDPGSAGLLGGAAHMLALSLRALRVLGAERELRERSERQAAENAALLDSLRERQRLLERLTRIQHSISRRVVLQDVLDAIVMGAGELIGDEMVGLRLIDPDRPGFMTMASSRGVPEELARADRLAPVGQGAGGGAIAADDLVVIEGYGDAPNALPGYARQLIQAAMAAPVRENGRVVGSLTVASLRPGRAYSPHEREALIAFAEHASLALTDARTLDDLRQAFHDPLTGLPNRALFLDRLEHALARDARQGSGVAALFVDLDRFKVVNDSLGHDAGNRLLVAVAERLRSCLRDADTAARLGGDEFAVLLDTGGPAEAVRVADRVIAALAVPFRLAGREVFIGASIGIATRGTGGGADGGADGARPEDLLRDADLAMYRAKKRGGGRHAVYEPAMHAERLQRLELEADLQRAVERGQFVLHYQPIVDLDTLATSGVEALVRWVHPSWGLIPPAAFIPVAEETGLVVPIGRWVLAEACLQARRWRDRHPGRRAPTVNVNLSAKQLAHPDLPGDVARALAEAALDPDSLVLEITESAAVVDAESAIARLEALRALGVHLAIDDFGTGYSSLSHLRRFPVDFLKIDRSFVEALRTDQGTAFLSGIVRLAQALNLRTVAEGIERAVQLELLRDLGCAQGQGFHFAPPLEATAIDALLGSPIPGPGGAGATGAGATGAGATGAGATGAGPGAPTA